MWLVSYALQTASVAVLYIVGFTGGTHILGLVTLYQLFRYTPLWPLVILYLSWTYLVEWKTPARGGRNLFRNFARRLAIFRYIRDYYPITLVKTSELDPQKNYILGYHPHGVFTEGVSMTFGTEACGFSEKFPGIIPHVSVHSGKNISDLTVFWICIHPTVNLDWQGGIGIPDQVIRTKQAHKLILRYCVVHRSLSPLTSFLSNHFFLFLVFLWERMA